MLKLCKVTLRPGSREELFPELDEAFPCLTDRYGLYAGEMAPWHWHKGVELFYVESGCVEYVAPSERAVFTEGMGGMINANSPHMAEGVREGVQCSHMFDPLLIAGSAGSRIEKRYVLPLTAAPQVEIIALEPANPAHAKALELLKASFALDGEAPGYELKLRAMLSEIWLEMLGIAGPRLSRTQKGSRESEQMRMMLVHVHEHYGEKLTVRGLARIAMTSERACYSLFREHLHTTPMEYVETHRIRMACRMLAWTSEAVADIGTDCGLGSGGRFSRTFRKHMGCTPLQYRKKRVHHED